MDCKHCAYCNRCKHPNESKPACLMKTRYDKAVVMARVPKKYRNSFPTNIPIQESNPEGYRKVIKYCKSILMYVEEGYSIYLYSDKTVENPLGTGTGKTTCACAILNKFLAEYIWESSRQKASMLSLPALFMKCSDFQNKYAEQCRNQIGASDEYYNYKNNMKTCKLLVLDDIAIKNCTEAFMSELYEVIDHRVSEELATIYTSNVSREELEDILGQRIQSRLYENCIPIELNGEDHRF